MTAQSGQILSQALQSVIGWANDMVQLIKAPVTERDPSVTLRIHMEEENKQLSNSPFDIYMYVHIHTYMLMHTYT